jgi:hypothetical protein
MSTGNHPTPYANYSGTVPRIASVLTPLDDDNLALVAQIGVTGELTKHQRLKMAERENPTAQSYEK